MTTYKAFGRLCSLLQCDVISGWCKRRPGTLTDSSDWAPPPLVVPIALSVNLSFMILFQIGGRLYRPPSLLSEGFKARMCIASFTPLSNHLCSTTSIFVFSNMMVWSLLSVCMCFETSDVVELGLLCSPNLAFSERSVSPT